MNIGWIGGAVLATALGMTAVTASAQDWTPDGPVAMQIGFRAGGGADSMGRLVAQELSDRLGWEIIPQNVAGRGGLSVAADVLSAEPDGLTIGISTIDTFGYALQTAGRIPFGFEDFTYITTLTGSQMGLVARADRGWATLGDAIEAARSGEAVTVGVMNQKLADATYVLGEANGVSFTTVLVDGGRGGLNGVVAQDLDISWVAGLQAAGVRTGEIVNLASAEDYPLPMSPEAPLLSSFNIPFSGFGSGFLVFGPADMPEEVATTYAREIAALLNDPESAVAQFVTRSFSGPWLVQGDDLHMLIEKRFEEAAVLIDAASG